MRSKSAGVYRLTAVHDGAEISELRLEYLAKTGGFSANREAMVWGDRDEESLVLGVRSEAGRWIASMRAEILSIGESLIPKMDYDPIDELVDPRSLRGVLGKEVTHPDFRGLGLNTYLRQLALEYLLSQGVQTVVTTVKTAAPRVAVLGQIGTRFFLNKEGWRRFGYQSMGPTLVGILDLSEHGEKAIRTLRQRNIEVQHQFPNCVAEREAASAAYAV